jgi:hypothetical protein
VHRSFHIGCIWTFNDHAEKKPGSKDEKLSSAVLARDEAAEPSKLDEYGPLRTNLHSMHESGSSSSLANDADYLSRGS